MKKIFIAIAMISFFFGCKYDDDYLNPKLGQWLILPRKLNILDL